MTPAQTQPDLAKAASVGKSTVIDFERSRRKVSPEKVHAMRIALEVAGVMFIRRRREAEQAEAEMNLFRASAISTAVLIGASFLPWIGTAHAQRRPFEAPHAQDGVYAVDITTRQGDCGSAYHLTISVSGGHVTAVGDTPIEFRGQINRRGIMNLTFRGTDKVAHATGRLANGSGSGTWSSPSLQCAGSWRAVRHN